jgi:hypothetical protein
VLPPQSEPGDLLVFHGQASAMRLGVSQGFLDLHAGGIELLDEQSLAAKFQPLCRPLVAALDVG